MKIRKHRSDVVLMRCFTNQPSGSVLQSLKFLDLSVWQTNKQGSAPIKPGSNFVYHETSNLMGTMMQMIMSILFLFLCFFVGEIDGYDDEQQ